MARTERKNNWLSLSEYSSKYGVSVSTLRRRIKGSQVKYKMINGKYYLAKLDHRELHVSSPVPENETMVESSLPEVQDNFRTASSEDSTFLTAKVLLDELKKAYMNSLQDQEKQIIQLKQQIADLKTVVMYLERENERLNSI